MATETVIRRWTVATWLIAGAADRIDEVAQALSPLGADAIAVQSIRERDTDTLGSALGMCHAWDLSHYPRSRLLLGSGVGLAVFTPHTISGSAASPIGEHRSTWSTKRRIVQAVTIDRHDATVYGIVHAVGPADPFAGSSGMPRITITPEQVGADSSRAIQLPDDATLVQSQVTQPLGGCAHLQATTFEQPWVKGDFPVL